MRGSLVGNAKLSVTDKPLQYDQKCSTKLIAGTRPFRPSEVVFISSEWVAAMSEYRGYMIEVKKGDGYSRVEIHPTRADLPILRHYWFFVRPIPENHPLNEAKRRIDQVLKT